MLGRPHTQDSRWPPRDFAMVALRGITVALAVAIVGSLGLLRIWWRWVSPLGDAAGAPERQGTAVLQGVSLPAARRADPTPPATLHLLLDGQKVDASSFATYPIGTRLRI